MATAAKPGLRPSRRRPITRVLLDLAGDVREPPAPLDAVVVPCAADRAGPLTAELARRLRACVRFAQAVAHQLVDAHVEVKLEFVADVRTHVVTGASGEGKQPLDATKSHAVSPEVRSFCLRIGRSQRPGMFHS